jgi:hypothetical protein
LFEARRIAANVAKLPGLLWSVELFGLLLGRYCRFSEKLSEYPVWITFSGLPGPERASKRQTDAPTMTLNASQIRTRVILGCRLPKPNRPVAVPWAGAKFRARNLRGTAHQHRRRNARGASLFIPQLPFCNLRSERNRRTIRSRWRGMEFGGG